MRFSLSRGYQGNPVFHLITERVIDGGIHTVQQDEIIFREPIEGGGFIRHFMKREEIFADL